MREAHPNRKKVGRQPFETRGHIWHMDHTDRHEAVVTGLAESVCSDATVTFAVVFGSWIRGESHGGSDLDIAIKFSETLTPQERFERRCFLSGELQSEGRPFVDVSDIETLPLAVAHDAVSGEFLCGAEEAFTQFKTTIESAFAEANAGVHKEHQEVINRIAEEGLRG